MGNAVWQRAIGCWTRCAPPGAGHGQAGSHDRTLGNDQHRVRGDAAGLQDLDEPAGPRGENLAQGRRHGANDRDGDGLQAAQDAHSDPRCLRPTRSRGERRDAFDSPSTGRSGDPERQTDASRSRPLAGGSRAPAHLARHRQPLLADAVRDRSGENRRRLRHAGRVPLPPRTTRPAGGRFRRQWLGSASPAAPDGDVGDLPSTVRGDTRTAGEGSLQPPVGACAAVPVGGGVRARRRARGERPAERRSRRPERTPLPARRPVGRGEPLRLPEAVQLAEVPARQRSRTLPAQPLHRMEANLAATEHGDLRRPEPRDL